MELKEKLYLLIDEEYRKFHANLIPGMDNNLGIRTPELRKIAKRCAKEYGIECINQINDDSYEEVLLQGMIIGYSKVDIETRLSYIENYLPKIDNWATCDLFVSTLKFVNKYQDEVWKWMMQYVHSEHEFTVRFVVVMLLSYYLNDEYIELCYKVFDVIVHDGHYVKMAVAWAISIAYIKYPKRTLDYLLFAQIDAWTYNKAIQKMIESNRVSHEEKEMLRSMKVKG